MGLEFCLSDSLASARCSPLPLFLSGVPLGPWVRVANLSPMLGQPSGPSQGGHALVSP